MPPLEPPDVNIDSPSSGKSGITSWVIWVLVVAVGGLFTFLINAQSSLVEAKDKEIDRKNDELKAAKQETADVRRELRECNEENRTILGGFSMRNGRKTMIITPSDGAQNANYENSN